MARTSKTSIGETEGRQADRASRAMATGSQGVQQAHGQVMAQHRAGQDQANRFGQMGMQMGQSLIQQGQFDEQMALQRDSLDLRAAESGFQRGDDRAAALRQQMDQGAEETGGDPMQDPASGGMPLDAESQQRLSEQTGKSAEYSGGRWVPTQERQDAQARKGELAEYQAVTDRLRAQAYQAQTASQLQRARASGDKEQATKLREQLMNPVRSNVNRFDRFMNGKQSDQDWEALAKWAPDEPELQAAIKARDFNGRVQAALNSKIAYDSLQFINQTGDLPDGDIVDLSSPQMQQFSQQTAAVAQSIRNMGPEWQEFLDVKSVAEKTAFINKMAARKLLAGMTTTPQMQPQGLFAGMPPSAGMPGQPGMGQAPGAPPATQDPSLSRGTSDPYATDAMTQQAIQARGAGQQVPPTDSPQFQQQFGGRRPAGGTDDALKHGMY